jgi:hypothetical protein
VVLNSDISPTIASHGEEIIDSIRVQLECDNGKKSGLKIWNVYRSWERFNCKKVTGWCIRRKKFKELCQ